MDKKKKQKSAAFKEDKGAFTGHEEKKTATKKAQKRASDNQPRDADSTWGQDAQKGNESCQPINLWQRWRSLKKAIITWLIMC